MEEPILTIKTKKYTEESTILSVRIPKDMIRDLDAVAERTGRTRNEIISKCLEFSLNHMEILDNGEKTHDRNQLPKQPVRIVKEK